jgi:VIT1/CCC1 family predicted Fe2+/Mn2+ transporter
MARHHRHHEQHRIERAGWLRAAVLGANDGIVSTSSLILGVASANGYEGSVILAGVAGVVAGAMSMAAGEYVSVHSQQDLERAALAEERQELKDDPPAEHAELAAIYARRGLQRELAEKVATQLMEHDALAAHARDELGITRTLKARPLQAAGASATSFAAGGSFRSSWRGSHRLRIRFPGSPARRWCCSRCSARYPRKPATHRSSPAWLAWFSGARLPWP